MIKDGIRRLMELRVDTIAAEYDMVNEGARFRALSNRHENGTAKRVITSFNLFVTPQPIAARMAAMIPASAKSILEPSAGTGRLYNEVKDREHITLVENSPDCCAELYKLTEKADNVTLKQRDFLGLDQDVLFDAVIMNPPFKRGRDIKHIQHALKFLKPGGVLVALCYNGSRQNKILQPLADSWEVLSAKTFKESGTNADVVLLTIQN